MPNLQRSVGPFVTPITYLSAPPGSGKTRTLVEHLCLQSLSPAQLRTLNHTPFLEQKYFEDDVAWLDVDDREKAFYKEYQVRKTSWSKIEKSFVQGTRCNFLIVSPTLDLMHQTFCNIYPMWLDLSTLFGSHNTKSFYAVTSTRAAERLRPNARLQRSYAVWPRAKQAFFGAMRKGSILSTPVRFAHHLTPALSSALVTEPNRQGALCHPSPNQTTADLVHDLLTGMHSAKAYGNFVFCTHATFLEASALLPEDVRSQVIVYFDEARSLVTNEGGILTSLKHDQRLRLTQVFKAPDSPKTYIASHSSSVPSTKDNPLRLPMPYWKVKANPEWAHLMVSSKSVKMSSTVPDNEAEVLAYVLHNRRGTKYDDRECGLNTITAIRTLCKWASSTNPAEEFYVKPNPKGRIDCISVIRPDCLFQGFFSVHLFAAYFETSQIYSLLRVSENRGKRFTLKSMMSQDLSFLSTWRSFEDEMDLLKHRAKAVRVLPLTDSTSLTSKEKLLTSAWFANQKEADRYVKGLSYSLTSDVNNLMSLTKIEQVRRRLTRPDLSSGKADYGRPYGLFANLLKSVVDYMDDKKLPSVLRLEDLTFLTEKGGPSVDDILEAREAFKGKALLSLNKTLSESIEVQPFLLSTDASGVFLKPELDVLRSSVSSKYRAFHLLPHNPHGLNKYLACTSIAYFKSSQPRKGEADLLKILTTRLDSKGRYTKFYSASEEIPTDLAVQAVTRTCLRAAKATGSVYVFVPDLTLARMLQTRLRSEYGEPKVCSPLTQIKFEHDVFTAFKRETLNSVRGETRPLTSTTVIVRGEPVKRYKLNLNSIECTKEFQAKVTDLIAQRNALKNKLRMQQQPALRNATKANINRIEAKLNSYC